MDHSHIGLSRIPITRTRGFNYASLDKISTKWDDNACLIYIQITNVVKEHER